MRHTLLRWRRRVSGERGYILIMVMLVLMVVGMLASVLMAAIVVNQQHVGRDRAYTESLGVAEAGLNQYLWMVASGGSCEANNFIIPGNTEADPYTQTVDLNGSDSDTVGSYTICVTPPSATDSNINVTVTGSADDPVETPRTVTASIGRPSFSEYVLLVNEAVRIGGPIDRQWWGKTHSNTQIETDTANINDFMTCANATFQGKDGVFSTDADVTADANSIRFWQFPVPAVDFATVTADFARYQEMAEGDYELPYVSPSPASAAHGWYIRLLPGEMFEVAQVTAEVEQSGYANGNQRGGYLTYGSFSASRAYPENGVILVNDNVWVEGTGLTGAITIAATGQFNGTGRTASINVIGDLTYAAKDGTVKVGLIAQENIKIPMYAPMGKAGNMGSNWTSDVGTVDMEIDAALIAQTGKEFVNFNGVAGPRRGTLTIYGSVSSYLTPYRCMVASDERQYAGFGRGANSYDPFLLHEPPPSFPTVGSYQILEWRELPNLID